jgi:hypothetical protein
LRASLTVAAHHYSNSTRHQTLRAINQQYLDAENLCPLHLAIV